MFMHVDDVDHVRFFHNVTIRTVLSNDGAVHPHKRARPIERANP